MQTPKAIVFDYGDTLLHFTDWDYAKGMRAVYDHANNPRGVPFDAVQERAMHIVDTRRAMQDAAPVEHHQRGFYRLIFDHFGMSFDRDLVDMEIAFWQAAATYQLTEGLVDLLEELSRRDIRMAILSNASFTEPVMQRDLHDYGIAHHFEFLISTAEFNITKPHPLIYEAAMGRLDLPAKDLWFVGDRCETDIAGANAVGMISVWYTGAVEREKTALPDLHVEHWSELIDELDRCAAMPTP